jgi:hypothetical protein
MRERRVYVKREQFTSASDKPTRQRAFQARAAMGKVLVPKAAPWLDTLMLQVLSFPLGKHDDGPDMLGLVGRMLDTMVGGRAPRGPDKPDSKWAQAFARRRNETPSDSWKVA